MCLGTPRISNEKGFESVHYETEGLARHFWWIHLIGLLWTAEFMFACHQFVIAGTVAVWYFTRFAIIFVVFFELEDHVVGPSHLLDLQSSELKSGAPFTPARETLCLS